MAKCAICEKGAHFGNNVSHSHRRSNKMWKSNIKSVKVKTEDGNAKKMYVCTSCLRSGKVERAYLLIDTSADLVLWTRSAFLYPSILFLYHQ